MLDVCLLGSGGMMPLPYRFLTALMTRFNGSSLLIDCGEGTQVAVKERGWSFKPIDVICFTHYHGDHISGLPGLLLTMGNADRREPLTLIGPKGLERVVSCLRVIAPELPFPIIYREIEGPEQTFEMNGYRLKAFRVNHNVLCYGYTLEIDRAGKFDVERAIYTLSRGSYQRASRPAPYHGKCRPEGASDTDRPERAGACRELSPGDRTGAPVSDYLQGDRGTGADI